MIRAPQSAVTGRRYISFSCPSQSSAPVIGNRTRSVLLSALPAFPEYSMRAPGRMERSTARSSLRLPSLPSAAKIPVLNQVSMVIRSRSEINSGMGRMEIFVSSPPSKRTVSSRRMAEKILSSLPPSVPDPITKGSRTTAISTGDTPVPGFSHLLIIFR